MASIQAIYCQWLLGSEWMAVIAKHLPKRSPGASNISHQKSTINRNQLKRFKYQIFVPCHRHTCIAYTHGHDAIRPRYVKLTRYTPSMRMPCHAMPSHINKHFRFIFKELYRKWLFRYIYKAKSDSQIVPDTSKNCFFKFIYCGSFVIRFTLRTCVRVLARCACVCASEVCIWAPAGN